MPGGSSAAWPAIKEIFQKTAAQVNGDPCCDWVGESGSGHYVKMVHNGMFFFFFCSIALDPVSLKVSSMAICN